MHQPQTANPSAVEIARVRAFSYRASARQSRNGPINYVIELTGHLEDGRKVVGLGEAQPRGGQTGDRNQSSWEFLAKTLSSVTNAKIPLTGHKSAIQWVRRTMQEIERDAYERVQNTRSRLPFRGTIAGIEMAILDLVSRAFGVPISTLLGKLRDSVSQAPIAINAAMSPSDIASLLDGQAGWSTHSRIILPSDADRAVRLMETVAEINATTTAAGTDKPLWVQVTAPSEFKQGLRFFRNVLRSIRQNKMPSSIVVMCPSSGKSLVRLHAELVLAKQTYWRSTSDIRVMGWPRNDGPESIIRREINKRTRALEVRPALVGGMLKAFDLVQDKVEGAQDTTVSLASMVGASRISAYALQELALAMPRIDSVDAGAAVESRITLTTHPADLEVGAHVNQTSMRTESLGDERKSTVHSTDANVDEVEHPITDYWPAGTADRPNPTLPYVIHDQQGSPRDQHQTNSTTKQTATSAVAGTQPGTGLRLALASMVGSVRDYLVIPQVTIASREGKTPRQYPDARYISALGSYGSHGHLLERECLAYGLNTRRFSKATFLADDGKKRPLAFRTARSPLTSIVAASIVRHKEATRLLLGRSGCPVPKGRTFSGDSAQLAIEYAERIGYPVVLKPAAGSMGVGVTANISSVQELKSALDRFYRSILGNDEFVVEKHIHGRDYRIMVLGDEVVAAVERLPASVVGDGVSTVIDLILAKNADRRLNPHLGSLRLKWNATAKHEAEKAGYGPNSVIPKGAVLYLNSANNLTQGGDSVEILDELHPSIIEASIKAVQAVPGLAYCGVDFLLEDHRESLGSQEGAICELNAVAAIPVAEYPPYGTPRPLAERFVKKCIEDHGLSARSVRADRLNLRMEVRGRVHGSSYMRWFARRAQDYGCRGWIKQIARRRIEIRIAGPTAPVSALAAAAIIGPSDAALTSVHATHVSDELDPSFRIAGKR